MIGIGEREAGMNMGKTITMGETTIRKSREKRTRGDLEGEAGTAEHN